MELNQKEDGTIIFSQNDYIDELVPITLDETRTKCAKDEPVDKERSEITRMIGKLNWLACMSRLEISFTVSDVSSQITTATISDMRCEGALNYWMQNWSCLLVVILCYWTYLYLDKFIVGFICRIETDYMIT